MEWCNVGWQIVFTTCFLATLFVIFASVNIIYGDNDNGRSR